MFTSPFKQLSKWTLVYSTLFYASSQCYHSTERRWHWKMYFFKEDEFNLMYFFSENKLKFLSFSGWIQKWMCFQYQKSRFWFCPILCYKSAHIYINIYIGFSPLMCTYKYLHIIYFSNICPQYSVQLMKLALSVFKGSPMSKSEENDKTLISNYNLMFSRPEYFIW